LAHPHRQLQVRHLRRAGVAHANCYGNGYRNANSDAYAYRNTDTEACSDAETASDAAAAPVALTGIVKA